MPKSATRDPATTDRRSALRSGAVVPGILAFLVTASAVAADDFEWRTVVTSGEVAPGANGAAFAPEFLNPRIDAAGRTAFYADLSGRQICVDGTGIWSERTGQLALVALEGQPAPGTNSVFDDLCGLNSFNPLNLGVDAQGHLTFRTQLAGPEIEDCNLNGFPENDSAWYTTLGGDGGLRLAVREDAPAPERSGETFDNLPAPRGGPAGVIGRSFGLKGGTCPDFAGAPFVAYVDTGSGFRKPVEIGAPGPIPGTTIATHGTGLRFTPEDPESFGYNVALEGEGIDATNDLIFVLDENGSRIVKVRENQAAPGVRPGLRVSLGFGNAGVSSSKSSLRGDVHAFVTELIDAGTGELVHSGAVYVSRADHVLRLVAKTGDAAPGIADGEFFALGLANVPIAVGDDGDAVFHGFLRTDTVPLEENETLHRFDGDGRVEAVAQEGAELPDRPGVFFGKDQALLEPSFGPVAMTRDGHFAFVAGVHGAGLDPTEANALLFRDRGTGVMRTVVMTGDEIAVGEPPAGLRTVRRISAFQGTDLAQQTHNGSAINEDEALVFALRFEDGTAGVFTARFVVDVDQDGIRDTDDGCPTVFDPLQDDLDGDGRGDPCDCAPSDAGAFAVPSEVRGLAWLSKSNVVWESQRMSAGAATTYEVVRDDVGPEPVGSAPGAVCAASGLSTAEAVLSEVPGPGSGFRYLIRAVNACGDGGLGTSSNGEGRELDPCP